MTMMMTPTMMTLMNGMAVPGALATGLPGWMGVPVWALLTLGLAGVVFAIFYLIDTMGDGE